jgi:uncharacterized protein YjbJ (UPF0337 family)
VALATPDDAPHGCNRQEHFASMGHCHGERVQALQTVEHAMNWDRVEGNWKQLKGQIQTQWGKLTDDDLSMVQGKRTELSGKLQERYGIAKDEAERQIDDWLNSADSRH